MLTLLSVDRVIAVWLPIFYFQNSKPKYALVASLTTVALSSVASVPVVNLNGIRRGMCRVRVFDWFTPEQVELYQLVSSFGLLLLVPLLVIFVANFLIVWKIKMRSSRNPTRPNGVPIVCLPRNFKMVSWVFTPFLGNFLVLFRTFLIMGPFFLQTLQGTNFSVVLFSVVSARFLNINTRSHLRNFIFCCLFYVL